MRMNIYKIDNINIEFVIIQYKNLNIISWKFLDYLTPNTDCYYRCFLYYNSM